MPGPFDPIEYVQWRTDCTADDILAWRAAWYERIRVTAGPSAPCLGCGRPIEGFSVPMAIDTWPVAMFEPCGCELRVRTPPILDHIPDGLFPITWAALPVEGFFLDEVANVDQALEQLSGRLAHKLGRRPDVVMLMDERQATARKIPARVPPDGKLLVAYTLHARPGTTKWIVYRAHSDLPHGVMPPGLDGRWEERARIPSGRSPLLRLANSTTTAHASGGIEIREDREIAEVYQVRHQ